MVLSDAEYTSLIDELRELAVFARERGLSWSSVAHVLGIPAYWASYEYRDAQKGIWLTASKCRAQGLAVKARRERKIREMFMMGRWSESECWEWTGSVMCHAKYPNIRYGRLHGPRCSINGEWGRTYAHRVAYILAHGDIPNGMTVDHMCFNPVCVNPSHLRLLTLSENSANKDPRKRGLKRENPPPSADAGEKGQAGTSHNPEGSPTSLDDLDGLSASEGEANTSKEDS